ncbi:MAG: transposase [Bacilli bacterium]
MWHLLAVMQGIILCEGRKTITQFHKTARHQRHLSCMTRFLAEAPWNHLRLNQSRLRFLRQLIIRGHAKQTTGRKVTFLIVDDTNSLRKPSTKRMERLDFHCAHSEGKSGPHVVVTLHVVTGALSIPWDFRPYFREEMCTQMEIPFKRKVDLPRELIEAYISRICWVFMSIKCGPINPSSATGASST